MVPSKGNYIWQKPKNPLKKNKKSVIYIKWAILSLK